MDNSSELFVSAKSFRKSLKKAFEFFLFFCELSISLLKRRRKGNFTPFQSPYMNTCTIFRWRHSWEAAHTHKHKRNDYTKCIIFGVEVQGHSYFFFPVVFIWTLFHPVFRQPDLPTSAPPPKAWKGKGSTIEKAKRLALAPFKKIPKIKKKWTSVRVRAQVSC